MMSNYASDMIEKVFYDESIPGYTRSMYDVACRFIDKYCPEQRDEFLAEFTLKRIDRMFPVEVDADAD